MNLNQRYKQASKEARWSLYLTLFYVVGWAACAYLPTNSTGLLGFPLWFELSCIYLPILFIILAYLVIRCIYKDISLEPTKNHPNSKTN